MRKVLIVHGFVTMEIRDNIIQGVALVASYSITAVFETL